MGVNTLEEQTVVPGYKTRCLLWCYVQLEGCAIVGKQVRSVIQSLFTIGEKLFSRLTCSGMCQHVSLFDEIVINYGCIRGTLLMTFQPDIQLKLLMVIYKQFIVSCNNTIFQFSSTLLIKS